MPYDIWRSLTAKQKLQALEQENPEIVQHIVTKLNQLSIEREDFLTGSPERIEVLIIGQWRIYYRIIHRLKSIDIIDVLKIISY